ncbi:MAG: 30S ribosomal protein S8 [Pseudomonadales bacterium]|nr:30S ribosomal protein S8 [Pseudomonadales bacterium]
MSMSDPIADLLTRIRNAQQAQLPQVVLPSSKVKQAICDVLKEEGYITSYTVNTEGAKSSLAIELKYFQGKPVIEEIIRSSRPGRRLYKGKDELPKNREGLGVVIVSTNQGLMTDKQARAAGIGGEVLCTVF